MQRYKDSKVFIEHSNDMDDVCENIEEYDQKKERKNIVRNRYDMMICFATNYYLPELVIKGRKLNISFFLLLNNLNFLDQK